ncbi:protein yipf [Anaeramoeba ignava]|uniref:Protein YIPF n=1 Tax=Anaeramoeba ignava TaxID=1746090 RepID=A0A9Q0LH86_ANAIG|nr:protein yipf [Anaeramoeba ignava]
MQPNFGDFYEAPYQKTPQNRFQNTDRVFFQDSLGQNRTTSTTRLDFDQDFNEPPLLEELGINFSHIYKKILSVLNPFKRVDHFFLQDSDLAGPLLFFSLLGFCFLLSGKIHFGYIYGVGTLGNLLIYFVLNLMSTEQINLYQTISITGYCLLPLVILAFCRLLLPFGFVFILVPVCILWSSYAASTIFVEILEMKEQKWLVGYPVFLFFTCFAIMAVF